jgi:hypothetical protein
VGNITTGIVNRTAYKSGEVIRTLAFMQTGFNSPGNVSLTSTTPTNLGYFLFTPTVIGSKVIIEFDATYSVSGTGADSYSSRITIDGSPIQTRTTSYPDVGGGRNNDLLPIRAVWTTANTNQSNIAIQAFRASADDSLVIRNDSTSAATLTITEIAP